MERLELSSLFIQRNTSMASILVTNIAIMKLIMAAMNNDDILIMATGP